MKKSILLTFVALGFLVSCGNTKIEFSPINSKPGFQDEVNPKKNPYLLELVDENYSYSDFKAKYQQIFKQIKSKNVDEFPFACDNGARNCLKDQEINYLVIKQLVKDKILNFSSISDLPLPESIPKIQVSFISMMSKFFDEDKKLTLHLEFGHFHSSQPHIIQDQHFTLNFKK
ncbi:hypothetical protein R7U62_02420 [Mesomycoplasma ovipneumoniae]|uniref:hypothetical protein n=1 Tax=Mesomycoplasma ovipneumoniae TaxID=29562 RepID=UPI0029651AA1|nr:hypothetical protein [Mesomycoplasma ovipneumoniae]MDW2907472.1 hypothetical protein [Mesomycoplasma ovipneumoniae]MDW2912944.1 hypothetical protein [Mesomycoplasma ovipneumoniae]